MEDDADVALFLQDTVVSGLQGGVDVVLEIGNLSILKEGVIKNLLDARPGVGAACGKLDLAVSYLNGVLGLLHSQA